MEINTLSLATLKTPGNVFSSLLLNVRLFFYVYCCYR